MVSAPLLREDRTVHPVGRRSGTHLDNGLAVTSIPRGKEWLNGKVRRPSTKHLKVFQKMVYAHLQERLKAAVGNGFGGSITQEP